MLGRSMNAVTNANDAFARQMQKEMKPGFASLPWVNVCKKC
jgi:hypothetical protein